MVANLESSDDALMTIREAAAYLRCSRATLFRFLQRGQLVGFKVGQKTVVYARDVKQLVRARESSRGVGRPASDATWDSTPRNEPSGSLEV